MLFEPDQLHQILNKSSSEKTTADNDLVENQQLLTPAAVLVPLVERYVGSRVGYHVLLTRRSKHLKNHPGQISFPGGSREPQDLSLLQTALRETFEEIGILPHQVHIIGQLPPHETITRYLMTPFVGIIKDSYKLTLDPSEVEEAFEVPLSFICDPKNLQLKSAYFQGQKRYYFVIQYHHYTIWGATARILVEFSKSIRQATNRLDHCAQ
jgi:8-oxo-dGTP pyrophosphatase MutT (NUDIX family)